MAENFSILKKEKSSSGTADTNTAVSENSFFLTDNRAFTTVQKKQIQDLSQKKQEQRFDNFRNRIPLPLTDKRPQSFIQKKQIELMNGKFEDRLPVHQKKNNTGLPDKLKAGVENLSGISLDDVKVYYNSKEPALLNAHAYAQGTNIHLSSGQEKHLPHEAWHVVQQKQGRVRATKQLKSFVAINDDAFLEKEADVMGTKALLFHSTEAIQTFSKQSSPSKIISLKDTLILPKNNYTFYENTSIIKPDETTTQLFHSGNQVNYYPASSIIQLSANDCSVIQLAGSRTYGELFFPKKKEKRIIYITSWIADITDAILKGNFYDGISLLLAMNGDSSLLIKAEEILRYLQHHPEVLSFAANGLGQLLGTTFGVPVWLPSVIITMLSRGATADWIGDLAFSYLMTGPNSGIASALVDGLKRRLGRSVINRGLTFAFNAGGAIGGALLNLISRIFHGYSINAGALGANDNSLDTASNAFGLLYSFISPLIPLERLHIIAARWGGPMNSKNAAIGSAATNSLMIPNERAGKQGTAIQSPSGILEGMGMYWGAFWGRGIRSREGIYEHEIAKRIGIA